MGKKLMVLTGMVLMLASSLSNISQLSAQEMAAAKAVKKGSWISHPTISGDEAGVYHFRRAFTLNAKPEQFNVQVSADNRYRLFVNGVDVAAGPQRSDLMHWRYETIDLSPYLNVGKNVIAALVWNWGEYKPVAQYSHKTGFLLQSVTPAQTFINTGTSDWKVLQNKAYDFLKVTNEQAGGYYASPPGEKMDGRHYPWGWLKLDYDASSWKDATIVGKATARGSHPYHANGWQLVERSIPMMDEHPIRFDSVRRSSAIETDGKFIQASSTSNTNSIASLMVPANTKATLLLDQAHLTNAYLVMETSKGAGATVSFTFAEALKDDQGRKGHRDVIEGKSISGVKDVFTLAGGEHQSYQTLWFRTYRYVEMTIETKDEPVEIHDVSGLYTAYPYHVKADFNSELPWLEDMWDINVRVAQLCAWETYFDTPYYEQLQYIGDTRLQALIQLYMTGDDQLMRQAITHFDLSRIPEGITASRYPSDKDQFIPPFSLFWVAMVHDYQMHIDDTKYVKALMPGVRSVLGWFEDKVDATGLVGPLPFWPFVDWAQEWNGGRAPKSNDGHSILITLQYIYALQRAIELEKSFDRPAEAKRLQRQVDKLLDVVRNKGWDANRGLFFDALEEKTFSQHTNTLAILTGAVAPKLRVQVMESILDDESLSQAGYYFSFYVLEALHESGLAHRYIEQLTPWQDMLALGLTTTPEKPGKTRSDSHAWAAHPNYGLLATVLGIRPAESGFKSVTIKPELGDLQKADGKMPHPQGEIKVRLQRVGQDGVTAEITLPVGLSGTFIWKDKKTALNSGHQVIKY